MTETTDGNDGTDESASKYDDYDYDSPPAMEGDARPRQWESPACPNCGDDLEHGPIVEHGSEDQTTEYSGWSCPSCSAQGLFCVECFDLHSPDEACDAQAKRAQEEAIERLEGLVSIPGGRIVSIEECDTSGDLDGGGVYIDEDACPECGGDVEIQIHQRVNFEARPVTEAEWEALASVCTNYSPDDDVDGCSYHEP